MENLNTFIDTQNLGETNIVNSRKKGSFLEWFIKRIFQTVGFYAANKQVIDNNQIDVFVNYNDVKILVQCKQYEKSTPPVKDLIHEWNSKRIAMECDKALLVLWGYKKVEDNELKLAKKLKVYLWNDILITYFFDLILSDVNKAKNEILLNLEIDNKEIQKFVNSIREDIEKIFKDFSLENVKLVNSLKEGILDCFRNGILIKQKKFEIIWKFLIHKKFYMCARWYKSDIHNQTKYILIRNEDDFSVEPLNKDTGYVGCGVIFIDGSTIVNKNLFDHG